MADASAWHEYLRVASPVAVALVVGTAISALVTLVFPKLSSNPSLSRINPGSKDAIDSNTRPVSEGKAAENRGTEKDAEDADLTFMDWISLCLHGETVYDQLVARKRKHKDTERGVKQSPFPHSVDGVLGAIGNTPLIRIASLSEATGCEILGKAEFLNPGGSVKDRVALRILQEAMESRKLQPGGLVTEGSAGSTGIALALVARALGCRCFIAMPDDAAEEKAAAIRALGAEVERVRPVSITHPMHFVNVARRKAEEAAEPLYATSEDSEPPPLPVEAAVAATSVTHLMHIGDAISVKAGEEGSPLNSVAERAPSPSPPDAVSGLIAGQLESGLLGTADVVPGSQPQQPGGFFADQFENLANFRAHYFGTGPEIWKQTGGRVDAFVAAAGTGGTLAGVSSFLKDQNPLVKAYLIDPPGSSLYNRVCRGVMYAREEAEGKRLRNPFDTITEGIGINRLTNNFLAARVDGAFKGTDREAVEMARYLMCNDGLFLGSSSAMNCVGAVRAARQLGRGHTIVTVLCDSGFRHVSKFHNPEYLALHGLTPSATGLEFIDNSNY